MFTTKEFAAFSHLSDYKARAVIDELMEARRIELVSGTNGTTMQYRMADPRTAVRPDLLKPFENQSKRSKACK
jgi:hypothetical protein